MENTHIPRRAHSALLIGFGLVALVVGANVAISTWAKGYWGRDNAAMRYLFQCSGTLADEQARWEPKKVLVSACSRPFIVDVSPSGRIATVKVAQPSPQTLVLDGESGRVVLTMERPRGVLALSDVLLYYTVGEQDHKIYDLALHQEFPIVKLPSQSTDLSVIEDARDEARGNYEYYEGSMQLFVFNLQSSRRAIDISEITYETYLELSDSWDLKTRVVMANTARPDNSPFRGGSRSCVIGRINPDLAGPGLLEQFFAHVCWFEYTNPILLDP